MATKLAMPFGFSFDRVYGDVVEIFGEFEAVCLVLGPRDGSVTVDGSVVHWTDRGEDKKFDMGVPVTPIRLGQPVDGVLDLAPATAEVRAFGPDLVILNGGITPVQGVLWGQNAPKFDVQRDGAIELRM